MAKTKKEIKPKKISQRLRALGNDTRLALLGLIYVREEASFSQIKRETRMESNKLAYHMRILKDAGLIKFYKNGYLVTNDGEKLMKNLGYLKTVKSVKEKCDIDIELKEDFVNEGWYTDYRKPKFKIYFPIYRYFGSIKPEQLERLFTEKHDKGLRTIDILEDEYPILDVGYKKSEYEMLLIE